MKVEEKVIKFKVKISVSREYAVLRSEKRKKKEVGLQCVLA